MIFVDVDIAHTFSDLTRFVIEIEALLFSQEVREGFHSNIYPIVPS